MDRSITDTFRCNNADGSGRNIAGNYLVLPDLRGEFLRGWNDGRGIDLARLFASLQLHALQSHWHEVYESAIGTRIYNSQPSSSGIFNRVASGDGGGGFFKAKDIISDGTNGAPNIAAETRPRNVALLACIKF